MRRAGSVAREGAVCKVSVWECAARAGGTVQRVTKGCR